MIRGWAVPIAALLLVPVVAALPAFAPMRAAPAPLPADLSDADLLRMVARVKGIELGPTPRVEIPAGLTLPVMVMHVGQRAGKDVTPADVAPFAALDPRVAEPSLRLLVALDGATTLLETAYAKVTPQQRADLLRASLAGDIAPHDLALDVDERARFEAAILVLDTAEGIVIPALQDAAEDGAWPAGGAWDPVGVLRLGSTGTDKETIDRIVQIDPSGDDWYYNNAGGADVTEALWGDKPQGPIGLSLDFAGNDHYTHNSTIGASQGGAWLGFAWLYDAKGDDQYRCGRICQGGAEMGATGLLRDLSGNDRYWGGSRSIGGGAGNAILRDDAGNDEYKATWISGGGSEADHAFALLWDRGGSDKYLRWSNGFWELYGYSYKGGRGWIVDEGPETDEYSTQFDFDEPHGCNSCTWTAGRQGDNLFELSGRGNDNAGGLAALMAEEDAIFPPPRNVPWP